jgi:hypothetical protein
MRIIFSRKGFDSSAGGCPSPIWPNGRLLSLPIPDKESPVAYKDIAWGEYNLGQIVTGLTNGRITPERLAHLDPDLNPNSITPPEGWRPIFGQANAAQGHLKNQRVGPGDLFLFFGLFREVMVAENQIQFKPDSPAKHIIWGWLQIETKTAVDETTAAQWPWVKYHHHLHFQSRPSNTVYIARKKLDLPALANQQVAGGGIFPKFIPKLQLTAPDSPVSCWKLPLWMFPEGKASALSYHGNLNRWRRQDDHVLLQVVGRGQEFVLDCTDYPEAIEWIGNLIAS